MARGWGRSEEDQPGDKEHASSAESSSSFSPEARERLKQKHVIELSLARIEEQLAATSSRERRSALESARAELREKLARL
jgi:hypothetical protein